MLVEEGLKEKDVVSMKLASGEEIVARYVNLIGTDYIVQHPMVLIARQEGLGLAPFMFSVKPAEKFKFAVNNVLCAMPTEEGLAKQYMSQTSGLIL